MFPSDCFSFSPVMPGDKPLVDRYMRRYGEGSCQHSFAALYTLSEKYGSMICERDGFLFTLRQGLCSEGRRVYLAPMGAGDRKSAYAAILSDAAAHGCRAVFDTVTGEQANFLRRNFPGRFRFTELRDYAEYIYLTDTLAKMKGGKFADKRNKINKLLRTYGDRIEVRPLSAESSPAILSFEEKWLADNAAGHDRAALELELREIQKQLVAFDLLDLRGISVYCDGEMLAFAYGVALNESCFDGLIAKASYGVPNLYKLLYWKMSCLSAAPFPYFNWEEDVGVAGLRQTKSEYGPALLMRKYLAEEADAACETAETETVSVISAIPLGRNDALFPGSWEEYNNIWKAEE